MPGFALPVVLRSLLYACRWSLFPFFFLSQQHAEHDSMTIPALRRLPPIGRATHRDLARIREGARFAARQFVEQIVESHFRFDPRSAYRVTLCRVL
jgi:hypothetical protein